MGTTFLIIALLVAAAVLVVLEILTPSFGILGAMAFGATAAAVWQGFLISSVVGWSLIIALVLLTPPYVVLMVKWLPNTPLGQGVFLKQMKFSPGEGTPQAEQLSALVGHFGESLTPLRPSGTIRVERRRIDAVAESGMIDKGVRVKIIRAGGTNVVVRQVDA